jgi:hypothetical protein
MAGTQSILKPGTTATAYGDPFSRQRPIGLAKLIRFRRNVGDYHYRGTQFVIERWDVEIEGKKSVHDFILPAREGKSC